RRRRQRRADPGPRGRGGAHGGGHQDRRRPRRARRTRPPPAGSTLILMTSSELRTFTSESVTEGHPDKICDQISDAILDDLLSQDRGARVAVETMVTTGLVHVAGEVRTSGYSDVSTIVRDVIREIGYDS